MRSWKDIDGTGAACVDDAGRVEIVVADDCAELLDRARKAGLSADDVLNHILKEAESAKPAGRETSDIGTSEQGAVPILRASNGFSGPRRR